MIECVMIDVNTQWDFCDRHGALTVANVKALIPALRRVVAWTKRNGAPVISTVESHRPFEMSDSGNPICCVDGSGGQNKVDFTILQHRINFEVDTTLSLPGNPFKKVQQALFRMRGDDLFSNPKAERLFTYLPVKNYYIFGIGLECAIKSIVLSLLTRERNVSVIADACGYWQKQPANLALRQLNAKGATLITVDELLQRKLNHRYRSRYRKLQDPVESNGRIHTSFPQPSNGKSHEDSRHDPDLNGYKPIH